MQLEKLKKDIVSVIQNAVKETYQVEIDSKFLEVVIPKDLSHGDFTVSMFLLAKNIKKAPMQITKEIVDKIIHSCIEKVTAEGPYLNIKVFSETFFSTSLQDILGMKELYGTNDNFKGKTAIVEYSSPNTNKPLHIGHVRNDVLGHSVVELLSAVGYKVIKACLVNDRGIHICKSMVAYKRYFDGITPRSSNMKGDHFVGSCYVKYNTAPKDIENQAILSGSNADSATLLGQAEKILLEETAKKYLLLWESGDKEIRQLWETMNSWVYEGFESTYNKLGITFDKFYYESELYLKGKEVVLSALNDGKVTKNDDGSISILLDEKNAEPKTLLRSDGTSLYITQDIGVALQKWEDYQPDRSIYVIGNEQDFQMKTLFSILSRLGFERTEGLYHLSYGMVFLPEGKMKSREGKVVDADDLIDEMINQSKLKTITANSAKSTLEDCSISEDDLNERAYKIALGAIKFYMLKINAKKDFVFNPEESIQLQGDTGPYIQYTYARIKSIIRKATEQNILLEYSNISSISKLLGNIEERGLLHYLIDFPRVVSDAANKLSPSTIISYLLELASAYNKFYHNNPVLSAESQELKQARLALCVATSIVLKKGLSILGIETLEVM